MLYHNVQVLASKQAVQLEMSKGTVHAQVMKMLKQQLLEIVKE